MSGNIAISSSSPGSEAAAVAATPASAVAAPAAAATAAAASSKRPLLNPSLHLDLALNLVVLQFVDAKGDVTSSFPSAKQIKAYKAQQSESAPAQAATSKASVLS